MSSRVMLLREYVGAALREYFRRDLIQSSSRSSEIAGFDFKRMVGEAQYRTAIAERYDAKPHGWMTPVEIFYPHYSRAIAAWIHEERRQEQQRWQLQEQSSDHQPKNRQRRKRQRQVALGKNGNEAKKCPEPLWPRGLHIVEVGGGVGHNARAILDWFEAHRPSDYAAMRYTLLDVSDEQAAFQEQAVARHGPNRCRVVVCPYAKWADAIAAADAKQGNWRRRNGSAEGGRCLESDEDTFVLALELADNLPHDKVTVVLDKEWDGGEATPNDSDSALVARTGPTWELFESVVVDGKREGARPLADPLLSEAVHICWDTLIEPCVISALEADGSRRRRSEHCQSTGTSTGPDSSPVASFLSGVASWATQAVSIFSGRASLNDHSAGAFNATFVPTGAQSLFAEMHTAFPCGYTLFLADFDALPHADIKTKVDSATSADASRKCCESNRQEASVQGDEYETEVSDVLFADCLDPSCNELRRWQQQHLGKPLEARGAPIVSSRVGIAGENVDHETFLLQGDAYGSADLLFPSHFGALAQLFQNIETNSTEEANMVDANTEVLKSRDFFGRCSGRSNTKEETSLEKNSLVPREVAAVKTRCGYNPLLEDFSNTSVLIGRRRLRNPHT